MMRTKQLSVKHSGGLVHVHMVTNAASLMVWMNFVSQLRLVGWLIFFFVKHYEAEKRVITYALFI